MATDAYKELCISILMKRIEEGTRFGAADVEVIDFKLHAATVKLWGTYTLKVLGPENEMGGYSRPSARDIEVNSLQAFDDAHSKFIDEYKATTSRYAVLQQALNRPNGHGYLAYPHATKLTLERYDRKVLFERTCDTCCGDGNYTCRGCRGQGRHSCNSCGGHGSVSCRWCGGSGYDTCTSCGGMGSTSECETSIDHNGHSHTNWVNRTCTWCSGSGRNSCTSCGSSGSCNCGSCGGSGVYTCSTCAGSGKETCGDCDGIGCLIRTGSVETRLETSFRYAFGAELPDWVKETLKPLAGHASLAPLGAIETIKIEVENGDLEARAEFRSYIPYAEVTVTIKDRTYVVRMMGIQPTLYDTDNLFQDMLLPDLDALQAATGGWGLLNPFYHWRVERAIRPFLESEINQKMVSCLHSDKHDAIVKKLVGAVNEEYVAKADKALCTLVGRSIIWARLRWMASIAFLTPVCLFLAFWYVEYEKQHSMLPSQSSLILLSTENTLLMGLTATPLAWTMSRIARWSQIRWLTNVGNKQLSGITYRDAHIPGKWTTLFNIAVALIAAFSFGSASPIWMDQAGKLQGKYLVPGFLPPIIVKPDLPKAAPKAKPKPKKRYIEKAKKRDDSSLSLFAFAVRR